LSSIDFLDLKHPTTQFNGVPIQRNDNETNRNYAFVCADPTQKGSSQNLQPKNTKQTIDLSAKVENEKKREQKYWNFKLIQKRESVNCQVDTNSIFSLSWFTLQTDKRSSEMRVKRLVLVDYRQFAW
jgi:hypothetical protein